MNPSTQAELPPKGTYPGATAYTPDQLKALSAVFACGPLESPVGIAGTYGLRPSEVCGLRWNVTGKVKAQQEENKMLGKRIRKSPEIRRFQDFRLSKNSCGQRLRREG